MAEKYLESIYTNPKHSGSFSGPEKLYQAVKKEGKFTIGRGRIRKWLQGNDTYTFNRIVHKNIKRNEVAVAGIDDMWDADIFFMKDYAKKNDGFQYVLLMIDIFSRYTWVRPLKTKYGKEIIEAMESIFVEGRQPVKLRTDKGREMTNVALQNFYKRRNIHHFCTHNETQANYAERCIKTFKTKIFRFMRHKNTHSELQNFASGYNHAKHRSLGMAPMDVDKDNEGEIRLQQYLIKHGRPKQKTKIKKEVKKRKRLIFKFKIGDKVRIPIIKGKFDREYDQKWTTEVFTVSDRFKRRGIPVYILKDWNNDIMEGTFYAKEMQKVSIHDDKLYVIEKVIKKKRNMVFVKWRGWPSKFNSWIPSSEVKIYKSKK
jgi:hypothetical protein